VPFLRALEMSIACTHHRMLYKCPVLILILVVVLDVSVINRYYATVRTLAPWSFDG